MGVRGLQTYIENYCPDACYEVSIRDLIETYRRETGRQPVIVVDGSSCLRYLYGSLDWVLGGQFKEYTEKLLKFVTAFESLGAKLVFYFDGATIERKRPVWIQRRLKSLQDVYKIYDCLNKWKRLSYVDQSLFQLPAGLGGITRFLFKDVCGCEVFTSIRECDEEIAEYAHSRHCFAILGQDTDYIIFNGAQYYFSMMNLNISAMTTLNYNRWALARHLRIHPNQLPILASLIGNDVISADDLKAFHIDICSHPDRRKYNSNSRIRFDILISHVAGFIRTLPCGDDVFQVLPAIAHKVFRDERRAPQLNASIRSYFIDEPSTQPVKEEPTSEWSKLMSLAKRRHIRCENPAPVWAVMNGLPYESSTALEDFREMDLPPAALALRPLRQRIYGLLLHEKPKTSSKPFAVKEWCMHGEDSLVQPALVEPVSIKGVAHPGLLTLWNKGADEVRWQVFAAAVSPHLNPRLLSELPAHLVGLASTLTYLHHELENRVLEPWEIEALIVQAVVLQEYDADRLSKLQVSNIHVRAIRISTLFMRSTNNIQFLLATCGYPVTVIEAMPYKYFDGKLFNLLYHKMKLGAKYEDECFQKVALMEQFLKVRQVVLGSLHS